MWEQKKMELAFLPHFQIVLGSFILLATIGCAEKDPSFSLYPDANVFYQNASKQDSQIDILWVMDNSGSMESSQQNVANNFQSFIGQFLQKNLDFQIAVTTTDSYKAIFTKNVETTRFRDGVGDKHSGVFVITPQTPSISEVFITNILQGIKGFGDERAFQSFREALNSPLNEGFHRPEAFLAVIIVSDEDDFSNDFVKLPPHDYENPVLHPVSDYEAYLDLLTNSTPDDRRYSVSAIAVFDDECKNALNVVIAGRIVARRYGELVDKTGGVKGSLCGEFSATLGEISKSIIELSTQFYLNRAPVPETLVVRIDGKLIEQSEVNGWSYDAQVNSIVFHGNAIPNQGAQIAVDFDPVTIK